MCPNCGFPAAQAIGLTPAQAARSTAFAAGCNECASSPFTAGAVGLLPHYGFCRLMTSARIAAYVDGTTEMQNEHIGAALFTPCGAFFEIRPDPDRAILKPVASSAQSSA